MTINITNIKNSFISYFKQIKDHPQAKQIYIGLFIFLVDHALTRIDRGAWGLLSVTGGKDDTIYSAMRKASSSKKDRNILANQSMNMNKIIRKV